MHRVEHIYVEQKNPNTGTQIAYIKQSQQVSNGVQEETVSIVLNCILNN